MRRLAEDQSITTTVGFDQFNYNAARNVYGAPPEGVLFRKVRRIPMELAFRRDASNFATGSFLPFPASGVDAFHTFNRIYFGRRSWGVTFESCLPRYWCAPDHPMYVMANRALAADACRFIIAMSESARRMLIALNPDAVALASKVHVLHPCEARAVAAPAALPPARPLRVAFVGNDAVRKGVVPLIRAAEATGVHLTVVSRLTPQDDVGRLSPADENSIARARAGGRVRFLQDLSSDQVFRIIDESHVLALPTLDDTFGYSVLEAMGRGRPVITTNIRAMPEMNDATTGWVLELPLSDRYPGQWAGMDTPLFIPPPLIADAYASLTDQLVAAFREMQARPETLAERGAAAHARAVDRFSPAAHAAGLGAIYRAAGVLRA